MFHPNSTHAFYKAAVSPRMAKGVIDRALTGLAQRGGVNTPKRLATEVQAMMKARPGVFQTAYPEYAGKADDLAARMLRDVVPSGSAKSMGKATRSYKKVVGDLAQNRRMTPQGGNPNVAYRPYAPEASPGLMRQVKREGGTQIPREKPRKIPKQTPEQRGQFVPLRFSSLEGAVAAPKVAPAGSAAGVPKTTSAVSEGATAKAVRKTPPPLPQTGQQAFIPGQGGGQPIPQAARGSNAEQSAAAFEATGPKTQAAAAAEAAAPDIAAQVESTKNVGKEPGLLDKAKNWFMTPEGKINPTRAAIGAGGAGLGAYGLYDALASDPRYDQNPYMGGY
jgi:hypothetical protein